MSIAVASFAIFAASQVGTPGPANMALMTTGARYGFRAALPFVAGVALGKQLIIWPVGFGLMELAERAPWVFEVLKYASAAYIIWLAWRVANMRLGAAQRAEAAPGFAAGLIVHPLNPKAWAMALTALSVYAPSQTRTAFTLLALVFATVILPAITAGMVLGQQLARVRTSPRRLALCNWTMAALLIASLYPVLWPA